MKPEEEWVGRHYDENVFDYELNRARLCPAEFGLTARQIERWIPASSLVAEVGVGSGHYSELMARRGCRLHLVDVSRRLLDAVEARLRAAGLGEQIIAADHASATNLDCVPSGTFDGVLMLGPLYHLRSLNDRQRGISEAARILRVGGVLFAAGINRLAYLRDLFRDHPDQVLSRRDFHQEFLRDGNLDPEHAPPIGYANLTTAEAFRELFATDFDELALLGVESFLSIWQRQLVDLGEPVKQAWLDLIESTAATPEGLGVSDHFLFIGRKKVS